MHDGNVNGIIKRDDVTAFVVRLTNKDFPIDLGDIVVNLPFPFTSLSIHTLAEACG